MTTIGYGDLSPSTPVSQFFTVILILCCIFLVFSMIQVILTFYINTKLNSVSVKLSSKHTSKTTRFGLHYDINDNNSNESKLKRVIIAIGNRLSLIVSPLTYLLLYLAWLSIWTLYFCQWNDNESNEYSFWKALYFGVITSSTVGCGVFVFVRTNPFSVLLFLNSSFFCVFF